MILISLSFACRSGIKGNRTTSLDDPRSRFKQKISKDFGLDGLDWQGQRGEIQGGGGGGGGERETETDRDRETETQTQTQIDRQTERQGYRDRQTETETDRQTDRLAETETDTERGSQAVRCMRVQL